MSCSGLQSSVWFNCVLRGDVNYIRVGARSNIQDGTIVHTATADGPTLIGDGRGGGPHVPAARLHS